MEQKELEQILQSGETYTVEFKENVNSDLAREMTAFANSSGGRIFVGITDSNEVQGLKISNSLLSQIQDIAINCDPPLAIELEAFNKILIITVKEGMNKPYRCNKGFFIRVGTNSQKMSTREITDFIQSEGNIIFDEMIRGDLKIEKYLDQNLIKAFLRKSNIEAILDDYSILHNLSVLHYKDNVAYLNNGGVLFFCRKPDPQLYHCVVSCALFKGTERITILDKKDYFEDIVSNVDNAMIFLKQHLSLRYVIESLQRKEILEIPEIALRELVLNAVCHRDYFDKRANVVISIFDDRIEISNPGGLPKGLAPKDFGKKSIPRNPLIASLFHRIGYIEKMGTGIFRIKKALTDAHIEGIRFEFDSFFTVTIPRLQSDSERYKAMSGKTSVKELGEKLGEKLGENEIAVISLIIENNKISITKLSELTGLSSTGVEKILSRLKSKKIIKRIGPAKGGNWKIIASENNKE